MNQDKARKTILVVDDTPTNIDVVYGVLSELYTVQAAINGMMALKIIEKKKPDLILLDIMMPDMNGYEVCRKIKENESIRDIPVIFLTAKTEIEDETKGFEEGAVDYITKPISPPVLLARVQTHLKIKEANDILKQQNELLEENARLRDDVERITQHDLKTPLNSILAYPQLIRKSDNLNENQLKFLNSIESSGRKLLNMINLSLDLYKMETGNYKVKADSVDLYQIIQSIMDELRLNMKSKKIEPTVSIDGKPADDESQFLVQGEELLFYSLLANLIKNAMEASPKNGLIAIEMKSQDILELSINNSGTVSEEIRDTFFDKYATVGKSGGTGLGTYSARLITETLGGQIILDTSIEDHTVIKLMFNNQ